MPKLSKPAARNEIDLISALSRLNLFYPDESGWTPTWSKKERIDLFDVPIPIDATYFKRSIGRSSRPLMILSERSMVRLYECLSTANGLFDAMAKDLGEKERLFIEEIPRPKQGDGG